MKKMPDAASAKALAIDLDGTLLTSDKRVTENTARAIDEMRARGTKLILATARTENGTKEFAALLRPDAVITCAGSLARAGDEIVLSMPLPVEGANQVISACKALGAQISILTEDGAYMINFPKTHPHTVETDFLKPLTVGAHHISVCLPDPAVAEEIAAAANCAVFRFSDSQWVRFGHAQACKERALEALLAHWGISPENAMAFGDDDVDIGMMKLCGYGVAMGNACAAVKACADWVTATNDEDGIALFLRGCV